MFVIMQVIDTLVYQQGKTNIASALQLMSSMFNVEAGDRRDVPNYGILVSDR